MSAFAEKLSDDTVRIVRVLAAPVEQVWTWLVDPGKRAKWFAAGAVDPRPGGRIICVFDHNTLSPEPGAVPERHKGAIGHRGEMTIIDIEPPHLLRHDWGDGSIVTFELAPHAGGTRLTLTHSRLPNLDAMRDVSGGWTSHLAIMEDVVAGRTPRNFWVTHEESEAKVRTLLG
ncbi:SRPBCC family protein [Sphingomonas sanxanigenens]|uniref:Activator of Hsp90 ATPase homologue 1/2-like C-terminal domain-containing protein n=1 Tax=Sphingomonas sanxanigenens DSM 19645 = NX02 TaxID=1123269 RepID=W0AMW6_9SPHN|nr:SRPBCC family protein [Sphingomonas sanxanigenens]AHE57025.1 hypothetical protein NX02_27195 [Sphingomonas sanxanigenens DSM 19645 = NX02]